MFGADPRVPDPVWAFYDALTGYNHLLIVEYDMTMLLGRFMIICLCGVLPSPPHLAPSGSGR